jgi:hypothetical protein
MLSPLVQLRQAVRQAKRGRPADARETPVFVMGTHAQALECWHTMIRSQHLPFALDHVVHVDSHPDMMLPQAPVPLQDDREALYEYLESSAGGIAEWLLPAFFMGHAARLTWVKAKWCDQLKPGQSEFYVGQHAPSQGALRVTSREPYFFDEGLSVAREELQKAKLVRFGVHTVSELLARPPQAGTWLLDVCLDYFAVANPFLLLAEAALGRDCARALQDGFLHASFRTLETERASGEGGGMGACERAQKQAFECLTRELWRVGVLDASQQQTLCAVLTRSDVLTAYLRAGSEVFARQAARIAEDLYANCQLPHHAELDAEQQREFADWLRLQRPNPPLAVTIARSDVDDYLPRGQAQADELEEWCLSEMRLAWKDLQLVVVKLE